jgi:hypothetical protein
VELTVRLQPSDRTSGFGCAADGPVIGPAGYLVMLFAQAAGS